jgi:hypothetical protein
MLLGFFSFPRFRDTQIGHIGLTRQFRGGLKQFLCARAPPRVSLQLAGLIEERLTECKDWIE